MNKWQRRKSMRWGRKRGWSETEKRIDRRQRRERRGGDRQNREEREEGGTDRLRGRKWAHRVSEGMINSWQKRTLTFSTRPWPALSPGQGHALHNLRNLSAAYLAVETNDKQHKEEEDGPQWRDGQFGDGLRVCHKGQARTWKNKGTDASTIWQNK